nr:hypothetical protein [Clostridium sp. Marseille-P7770]
MAKKITGYIILTAVISMAAFLLGRNCPSEDKFLNMETVTDYAATETGLMLYTQDGSGYYWERGEEK